MPKSDSGAAGDGGRTGPIEKHRSARARRVRDRRFELLARHAPVGIFMTDLSGDCVYVNERCCELAGLSAPQMMGSGWAVALHPEDRDRVVGGWRTAVAAGSGFESEHRFLHPDGAIMWVFGRATGLEDDAGTPAGFIGTISDITARKVAELALNATNARLEAVIVAREQLVQDLHDGCVQSIYAVGLQLDACRRLVGTSPLHAVNVIAEQVANLNLVIQDLRASISGKGGIQPGELQAELERTVHGVPPDAARFDMAIDGKAIALLTPAQALHVLQIVREAISNVVRHAGARVGHVSLRAQNGGVVLLIRDDGRGFDPGLPPGEGLGLHHIRARARSAGGRCQIDTAPAGGTRITVHIPR